MKPRLSEAEYLELGRKIKNVIDECHDISRIIFNNFPKSSNVCKKARFFIRPLINLYYLIGTNFLHDYPDQEVNNYGK